MSTDHAEKFDQGKPPLSLLDRKALEGTAQILAYGGRKYALHNWRKGLRYTRLSDAVLRHLLAFIDGEDIDPESGLPHVDHAACGIMFLQNMTRTRPDLDDRHKEA